MSERAKNYGVVIVFCFFLLFWGGINWLLPDAELSASERRRLAQLPQLSWANIWDASYMADFEEYYLDQFAWRDGLRRVKAQIHFRLLRQKDLHGVYIVGDTAAKVESELSAALVQEAAKKFNRLLAQYLEDCQLYYALVPDKSYYLAAANGYPALDYDSLRLLFAEALDARYQEIDLFSVLAVEDYYRTDSHWRQEALPRIAETLLQQMAALPAVVAPYQAHYFGEYYGLYYGQSALPLSPDLLYYLSNALLEQAHVYQLDEQSLQLVPAPLYDEERAASSVDAYDLFLSGARPLVVLENPQATTDKELFVFRDSFGSSLAPLLLPGYARVTLIDLRYIASNLLSGLVTFTPGSDVLLLYSTTLINHSTVIKVF